MSDNGIITVASHFPAPETPRPLEATIAKRGLQLFVRTDHAARFPLAVVAFLQLTLSASAADVFAGKYTSSKGGYRQNAEIARTADGYSVSIVVGTEGCSGLFEGAGAVQDGKLIAHSTDPSAKDDKCRIEISRNAKGITVHENECTTWHGASCDFEGTLRKRR